MKPGIATQTVLITGCSSGIGHAAALEFHRRGHRVCATARKPQRIADLAETGLATYALDVTDTAGIDETVARIESEHGGIDILINNAGYGAMGPAAEMPAEALRVQFDTNVFGCMALVRAVFPSMAERGAGRIVNIGSVSGILTTPFSGAYCASKAAVHALSDALRLELAPLGIRVITVQPGAIASQFGAAAGGDVERNVPPGSRYRTLMDAIRARANASQDNPTPAATFARAMADAVLAAKPASVVRIGKGSRMLPALAGWLPVSLRDRLLARRFQLDRLSP